MSAPIPGIGHNSDAAPDRVTELQGQIKLWVGNTRLAECLKRAEIASLEGVQRHLALSKSLVPSLVRLCRQHKRADCRAAILVLVTLLSDNPDGMCYLGVKRMAELFDRNERNVRAAIDSLEECGLLYVNRTQNGLPKSYWPAVAAPLATMNPAITWFVDALSDKPAAWGRPLSQVVGAKTPDGDINGKTPDANVKPRMQTAKTPDAEQHSISLIDITDDKKGEAFNATQGCLFPDEPIGAEVVEAEIVQEVSDVGLKKSEASRWIGNIVEEYGAEFHGYGVRWVSRSGSAHFLAEYSTEAILRAHARLALTRAAPFLASVAVAAMMSTMVGAVAKAEQSQDRSQFNIGAFSNFTAQVLQSCITKAIKEEAKARVGAQEALTGAAPKKFVMRDALSGWGEILDQATMREDCQ